MQLANHHFAVITLALMPARRQSEFDQQDTHVVSKYLTDFLSIP